MDYYILIVDDSPDGTMLTELAVTSWRSAYARSLFEREKSGRIARGFQKLPGSGIPGPQDAGHGRDRYAQKYPRRLRLRTLPVVITTLSTLESDEESAHKAGASAFIYKAIRFSDFSRDIEQQVRRWIKQRRNDEESRSREF